jgi:hypothetical protein
MPGARAASWPRRHCENHASPAGTDIPSDVLDISMEKEHHTQEAVLLQGMCETFVCSFLFVSQTSNEVFLHIFFDIIWMERFVKFLRSIFLSCDSEEDFGAARMWGQQAGHVVHEAVDYEPAVGTAAMTSDAGRSVHGQRLHQEAQEVRIITNTPYSERNA